MTLMTSYNVYNSYHRDETYLKEESLFRNIFQKRFNMLQRHLGGGFGHPRGGRVLDIGCSTGVFLDLYKEAGCDTWGVESSGSASVAGEKGHKIIKGFFENVKLPKNYFDLVILNHTLEHMDDPLRVLKEVHDILKRDGIVFVDVPNAGGLGAKLLGKDWPYRLPKEHKHQFTKENLSSLFRKAGFDVTHFESRSGIFECANPLLELWQSLVGPKKRFFINIFLTPYSLLATFLNMGDSISVVGSKK